MFFPLSVKDIVRDPFDPASRIDREISDRSRRLALGTRIEDDFQSLSSAMVVATGKGKYLRVLNAVTNNSPLPEYTAQLLKEVVFGDEQPTIVELQTMQTDIALAQSSAIEQLKSSAGKYVDRLLFVSVTQPEFAFTKNHQKTQWPVLLSAPQVLAENTGLSVISSFANRDILAGGTGQGLDALPAWILFADRNYRIASKNRILFRIGQTARAYFLPASDGIDSDLPDIKIASCPGLNRFDSIGSESKHSINLDELQRLNLDGNDLEIDSEKLEQLVRSGQISNSDFVRSCVVNLVNHVSDKIKSELPASTNVGEIVVHAEPEILGTFANQFRRAWPATNVYDGFGWDISNSHLQPILAATLGILSVDQLPANIPWVTGAYSQKVLGTITPGSPTNWRQLLREMADFQPPVMRLRDAV